jgi:hypothetical protein
LQSPEPTKGLEMTKLIPTDDDLLRQIEAAEATIAVCNRNIKIAKMDLLDRRSEEIAALLTAKPEPFGDITIIVGNHRVKVNVPKKVDWDAGLMAKKYKEIVESAENPAMYIKVDYSVTNFQPGRRPITLEKYIGLFSYLKHYFSIK